MVLLVISACLFLGSILPTDAALIKQNWDYTLLSINSTSSDESLIKVDLRTERVSRGKYAISGTIRLMMDDAAKYYIEVTSYRSASGSNNYKLLPFRLSNQTMKNYFEIAYKRLLMKSLAYCSDLMQIKGSEPLVLEKKPYTLNKCEISKEMFPSYMVPGYYKIVMSGTGPITSSLVVMIIIDKI